MYRAVAMSVPLPPPPPPSRRNITANTLAVLEAMAAHNVRTLIYSSTCATYGEPDKMPIAEGTPQVSSSALISETISSFLKSS